MKNCPEFNSLPTYGQQELNADASAAWARHVELKLLERLNALARRYQTNATYDGIAIPSGSNAMTSEGLAELMHRFLLLRLPSKELHGVMK